PFGGVNIIFAGDFAQLPPAVTGSGSVALYSRSIGMKVDSSQSISKQESAIRKAMWHQVTTVVILRENMHQKTQTADDAKLCTALVNMRYKSCTEDDIDFLCPRIVGPDPGKPKLTDPRFWNVPVITAWNSQKDCINELGCEQFAADTNQKLHMFYSMDKWAAGSVDDGKARDRRRHAGNLRSSDVVSDTNQAVLWSLSPHTSKHIAATHSVCLGMPVLIQNNNATKLCSTKGQEGTVAGWESLFTSTGKPVLDTLFVRLSSPPSDVQLDSLPPNVVPIPKSSHTVPVTLPNDQCEYVMRMQVNVLLNFAMTDYTAQGKTRLFNVVDLQHSSSHQSYYTCLSQSTSAEGTAIVQGFDRSKITGSVSGWLWQ
ncbi:hypothetical protein BV22DRAFT_994032, partial [Leucogyrophana mollusca]